MAADPIDHGVAGASARREHDRRKARREQATRDRHPLLGGVLLALREPPSHERVWSQGADGEAMVAAALEERCRPEVVVLHDRRIPRSRANIDHLAVAPTGVWVIDSKRYKGKLAIEKPWFGAPKLKIAGRDRTKLVDGLERQVELVRAACGDAVPVHGALCFVETELPLFGTPTMRGFALAGRKAMTKKLNADGPLDVEAIAALVATLAAAFRPA